TSAPAMYTATHTTISRRPRADDMGLAAVYYGSLRLGRGDVLDDEHAFARPNQTELATSDFLDGGGIVLEAARFVTQPAVLRALLSDRRSELIVFLPRAQDRKQAAIANETVDDDDRSHKDEEPVDDPPCAGRTLRLRRS